MVEPVIDGIVTAMQENLADDHLWKFEIVLVMQLHGLKIEEECTELIVSEQHRVKILGIYTLN